MKMKWAIVTVVAALAAVSLTWVPGVSSLFSRGEAPGGAPATSACGPNATAANLSFTLKDMHGKSVNLADYKGKVVLINFWATWCPPCKAEIPDFVELKAQYGARGFEILGISVDDPPEALPPFAERYKVNYPLLVGVERDDVQEAYGPIFGIPTSMLVARDGTICRKFAGGLNKARLEREIKPLL